MSNAPSEAQVCYAGTLADRLGFGNASDAALAILAIPYLRTKGEYSRLISCLKARTELRCLRSNPAEVETSAGEIIRYVRATLYADQDGRPTFLDGRREDSGMIDSLNWREIVRVTWGRA